jgi:hypothetical protein
MASLANATITTYFKGEQRTFTGIRGELVYSGIPETADMGSVAVTPDYHRYELRLSYPSTFVEVLENAVAKKLNLTNLPLTLTDGDGKELEFRILRPGDDGRSIQLRSKTKY